MLSRGLLKLGLVTDTQTLGRTFRSFNPSAVGESLNYSLVVQHSPYIDSYGCFLILHKSTKNRSLCNDFY